jgi:hypothetical protein
MASHQSPKADKVIILGDFNARVHSDNSYWDSTIGNFGIGNRWVCGAFTTITEEVIDGYVGHLQPLQKR